MKGRYLKRAKTPFLGGNIYADKSSLVLDWLLRIGIDREEFSLREVAQETDVSLGLAQRVFTHLHAHGYLDIRGIRTAKKFFLKNPAALLKNWTEQYNIMTKCKMWTYRSALQTQSEFLEALQKAHLNQKVAVALHTAAEAHGYKNTNLKTFELYMLDPKLRSKLEKVLELEPSESGYEVLLIEPYYKSFLAPAEERKGVKTSPPLLTFLDLYHFPLRGQEQAEFIAERDPEIKRMRRKK